LEILSKRIRDSIFVQIQKIITVNVQNVFKPNNKAFEKHPIDIRERGKGHKGKNN
jgi:hypothetical protein